MRTQVRQTERHTGVPSGPGPGQCHNHHASRRRAREHEARYRARRPEQHQPAGAQGTPTPLRQRAPDYFQGVAQGPRNQPREARAPKGARVRREPPRAAARAAASAAGPEQGSHPGALPPWHVHHPLFDEAWKVHMHHLGMVDDGRLVAIRDVRAPEDACSEVVLALDTRDANRRAARDCDGDREGPRRADLSRSATSISSALAG